MSETNGSLSPLDEWKKRRLIQATVPSGMGVLLEAMTLDDLAAIDGIPDDLVRVAYIDRAPGGVPAELVRILQASADDALDQARKLSRDAVELRDRLVIASTVGWWKQEGDEIVTGMFDAPLTKEDLAELDPYDKVMIAEIASRILSEDATGRPVYGDKPIATFQGADPVE